MEHRLRITSREILIEEFLKPKGICLTQFALDTGLTLLDVDLMSNDTANILSDYTGKTIDFWKNKALDSKGYDRALVHVVEMLCSSPGTKDFKHIRLLIDHIERFEITEYPNSKYQ
jgi:hypothetical protein